MNGLAGPSGRLNDEIVGSNSTGVMDVFLLLSVKRCQVEVSALGWSLVQRSPTECGASLCVWSRNLVNGESLVHWGAVAPKEINNNKNFLSIKY